MIFNKWISHKLHPPTNTELMPDFFSQPPPNRLPKDLIRMLMNLLEFPDQYHLGLTCKRCWKVFTGHPHYSETLGKVLPLFRRKLKPYPTTKDWIPSSETPPKSLTEIPIGNNETIKFGTFVDTTVELNFENTMWAMTMQKEPDQECSHNFPSAGNNPKKVLWAGVYQDSGKPVILAWIYAELWVSFENYGAPLYRQGKRYLTFYKLETNSVELCYTFPWNKDRPMGHPKISYINDILLVRPFNKKAIAAFHFPSCRFIGDYNCEKVRKIFRCHKNWHISALDINLIDNRPMLYSYSGHGKKRFLKP